MNYAKHLIILIMKFINSQQRNQPILLKGFMKIIFQHYDYETFAYFDFFSIPFTLNPHFMCEPKFEPTFTSHLNS